MPWRIITGYGRPAIVLSLHDEEGLAQYWGPARRTEASSCRCHRPNDPIVEGTQLSGDPRVAGTYEGTCQDCGKTFWSREANAIWCLGCEIAQAPNRVAVPAPPIPRPAAPAHGIHVAGAPTYTAPTWRRAREQRCTRCHAVLVDERFPELVAGVYPVGALVERGRGWQAMSLAIDAVPSCAYRTVVIVVDETEAVGALVRVR